MRKALLAGSLILGAAMAALSIAAAPSIVGKQAPDFALRGLDGRNLRLSEFRGQVVLVNFWTRSDGDSRQQMPALDRINITYQRAGLVVLGVSVDDDLRRAKEFAASMGVSYPILFDTGAVIGKDYFLQKMPMTILVDRGGVVRYSAVGFKRGDERVYLDQIRELLRE
jgi:peroxiredoxin